MGLSPVAEIDVKISVPETGIIIEFEVELRFLTAIGDT